MADAANARYHIGHSGDDEGAGPGTMGIAVYAQGGCSHLARSAFLFRRRPAGLGAFRSWLPLFVVFCAWPPAHGEDHAFVAEPVGVFAATGRPAMKLPTDVAVASDGSVFVADGVNDRVLQFNGSGGLVAAISSVGSEKLSRPVGLACDDRDRLWIADTGHHRVIVRTPDGGLERIVTPRLVAGGELPSAAGGEAAYRPSDHGAAVDITDVVPNADGRSIWLADNDHHRLLLLDLRTGASIIAGGYGESVGQLHHPFMLASLPEGEVLVSDVLNGRVARFAPQGRARGTIASYGVDLGQLYRPKGVAVEGEGNVFVADGTLGVVQVFTSDGAIIDVLRGADGRALRLQTPMGLSFDKTGDLYVVELEADRVSKLRIRRGPRTAAPSPPRRAQITGGQARSCTVCHVEWIEPFSRGVSTVLSPPPEGTAEEPAVSRAGMCLSCHDGSIVDSRRRVWQEHGHQTGMKPPLSMRVPPQLPLVNGAIACRTCHSAHATGQFTADMRTAVFLRVENTASQLCIACHADKTRGPGFGTHPTGGMPWAVPQALVEAGARLGPNPRELTCQVCHTPHGSKFDHLLVMGTAGNQLCLTCHERMRPGMFRDGPHTEHPLTPQVSAAQSAAIQEMGTRTSPEGRLICLSCHKLHHGKGERFMLAEELTDGRFCIHCHMEKTTVLGTSHDLRKNFPKEQNRLGMTAQSGGPCSACHLFHRYARAPEPSTLDPGGGKCITCHQTGRCAETKALGPLNHPGVRCVDCHDPHTEATRPYLRGEPAHVCADCHKNHSDLVGGPHDYRQAMESPALAAQWPKEALEKGDRCLACHRPHGDSTKGLFRFAVDDRPDAACRACHSNVNWGSGGDMAALHPRTIPASTNHGDLPVNCGKDAQTCEMGCKTCHDPHGRISENRRLLRVQPGKPGLLACAQCHADTQHIGLTGHAATNLANAGLDSASCRPCHAVHGNADKISGRLLWPDDLAANVNEQWSDADSASAACLVCHRRDGPARPPAIATHPPVQMAVASGGRSELAAKATAAEGRSGELRLYGRDGRPDPKGSIACPTCHLPHGGISAGDDPARLEAAPREQLRAMRLMLRPFAPPNLCTTCHGEDGLRRFLYFHDPRRRGDPMTQPTVRRAAGASVEKARRLAP